MAVYGDQGALRHRVRHIVRDVGIIMLYHPGQMSMQETSQAFETRGPVQIRGMQIAIVVRELVMSPMHRDP
jgi:hypothetical protein